jgi:hypothetical protein
MKLLFDQNLWGRLPKKLAHLFPDSQYIRKVRMKELRDVDIWNCAKVNGFEIVSAEVFDGYSHIRVRRNKILFGVAVKRAPKPNNLMDAIEKQRRCFSIALHVFRAASTPPLDAF